MEVPLYLKSMIYNYNTTIYQKNNLFHPEVVLIPLFCFKDTKNTGLLICNSLQQRKLILTFLLTVTEKN